MFCCLLTIDLLECNTGRARPHTLHHCLLSSPQSSLAGQADRETRRPPGEPMTVWHCWDCWSDGGCWLEADVGLTDDVGGQRTGLGWWWLWCPPSSLLHWLLLLLLLLCCPHSQLSAHLPSATKIWKYQVSSQHENIWKYFFYHWLIPVKYSNTRHSILSIFKGIPNFKISNIIHENFSSPCF